MKKIIPVLCLMMIFGVTAEAFRFPEPDWGALLQEKKNMVNAVDFELFTEGPVTAAPYYGARLEPRGGAYLGAVAENLEFMSPVGSYLTYFSMEDRQTDIYYPANQIIENGNGVVTIGYTVNSLDSVDYEVIRASLNTLAGYGKPMFIRFANEMNVSSLGDDPEYYVDVFRNVANMVHEYPNFAMVWSPNDLGALDRPFSYFYPGDEYVDWVGVSSYMKKYLGGNRSTAEKDAIYFMTGDYAWATNALKPIISFMEQNGINKPVMLSECGVATENVYGEECDSWASPRFRNLLYNVVMKYPQVKLINYFNTYRNEKERYYVCDSHNYMAVDKPYAMYILKEAAGSGAYIREANGSPEFVFTPANSGYTVASDDGILKLYTLAYVPKTPYLEVNYYIDGQWYGKSASSPYLCGVDLAGLSDGEHTVRIAAAGREKAYTFIKRGSSVCFGGEPDVTCSGDTTNQWEEEWAEQPTEQAYTFAGDIRIRIKYDWLDFDVPPVIVNDRTLVPLRAIFNALGAEVVWEESTQTVYASRLGSEISLQIGSYEMTVNGEQIQLDASPQLVQGRTMVPVRAISEAFGYEVTWDAVDRVIMIWD